MTNEEVLFREKHISPSAAGQSRYKYRQLGVLPDYERYDVDEAIRISGI